MRYIKSYYKKKIYSSLLLGEIQKRIILYFKYKNYDKKKYFSITIMKKSQIEKSKKFHSWFTFRRTDNSNLWIKILIFLRFDLIILIYNNIWW
jgi:hypothetical protein